MDLPYTLICTEYRDIRFVGEGGLPFIRTEYRDIRFVGGAASQ